MEPLSLKTRRWYAVISFVLFVTVLFVAAFYASGYRFSDYSLVRTGGVYVAVPVSNATVFLNGEEVGETGFLSKSFFIDNLNPGTYVVQVSTEDYYPWTKTLVVSERLVSDTHAFLVPSGFSALEIIATSSRSIATTTRGVSRSEYLNLLNLFKDPIISIPVATTTPEDSNGGINLFVKDGDVEVVWSKSLVNAPSAFCASPGVCVSEVLVESGKEIATKASFFRGGVVFETEKSGIYLAEIDIKPTQTVVPLYSRGGATFRIYEGEVLIKDGDSLFVISGF